MSTAPPKKALEHKAHAANSHPLSGLPANASLALAEHKTLLNTDMLGIARLERKRFAWTNSTFDLMFRYPTSELWGKPARTLYTEGVPATTLEKDFVVALRREGTHRTQLQLQRKTGEWIWVDIRGTMLSTDDSLWMLVDITGWKDQATRLETMAFFDPLTGLPNRAMLRQMLERELASRHRLDEKLAVCFLDLDRFKSVNDHRGHETGDGVLQAIAQRIPNNVRGHDVIGRIGGDEFVIVLTHLKTVDQVEITLSRLLDQLRAPIALAHGESIVVTASIGVAPCPDDATTLSALLRCSDEAMYAAKSSGGDRWRFYEGFG